MDPLVMELIQRAMSPEVDSQNYPSDMDPQLLELLRGIGPSMGMPPMGGMDPMMGGGMPPMPDMGMGMDPMSQPPMGDPGMGMPPEEAMPEEGEGVPSVTPPMPPPPPTPMAQPPQGMPGALMPPVSTMMPKQPGEMPDPALMDELMKRQMGPQEPPPQGF